MNDLLYVREPQLLFGHDQALEDPRDGLTLFGPLDQGQRFGIRYGAVGTSEGIALLKAWIARIQDPVAISPPRASRPPFPGFEAAFNAVWDPRPVHEAPILDSELTNCVLLDDRHQRVFRTVDLYTQPILDFLRQNEAVVDVWFIVVPQNVYKYCRPKSFVERDRRVVSLDKLPMSYARRLQQGPSLFPEDQSRAEPYSYDLDFRNQLKARLLRHGAPTQVIRQSTLSVDSGSEVLQSSIAWNLSNATFYKSGARPWKLHGIRQGVCYLGIVFKVDDRSGDLSNACCAAQMFLDSGDGMVFRGALGPWRNPTTGDFHLSHLAAKEIVSTAVNAYRDQTGSPPKELFIHGKVHYNDEEWRGFCEAASDQTNVVGVRISDDRDLKLYRTTKMPVLRGLAWLRDQRCAYLWTKGFVPRLQTYPGLEVPKPLRIDISRGEADIEVILKDVLGLTKLNYNSCRYGDGLPVTLRFADAVGEILTAGPADGGAPLPFKYYI